MIELEIMSVVSGHSTMHIEDVEPKKRVELAKTVGTLLKGGHIVFLIQGEESRRIKGYDAETNEWILLSTPHKKPKTGTEQDVPATGKKRRGRPPRISAEDTKATAIATTAGG